MAFNTTDNRRLYSGNGVTTSFSAPFLFYENSDIQVYLIDKTTGAETVQSEGTNYSVSGKGLIAGGTVTFVTAPPSTSNVLIIRTVPMVQNMDLKEGDRFPPDTIERAFDLLTMEAQQLAESVGRSVKLPKGSALQSIELPDAELLVNRGKGLKFHAAGTGFDVFDLSATPYTSPLVAKGDVPVHDGVSTSRLPVGSNGKVLTADSTQATGVKWGDSPSTTLTAKGDLLVGQAAASPVRLAVGQNWKALVASSAASSGFRYSDVLAVSIKDFGGVADGLTDTTAAFNAALAECAASGKRTVYFPSGVYKFSSKPNDITYGVTLVGDGITSTTLVRGYSAASTQEGFLVWTGQNGNGGGCRDMSVQAGQSTALGTAIKLIAASGYSPDGSNFKNLWLTVQGAPAGTWSYTVYIDGMARSSPQGVRDVHFSNVHVFGAGTRAFYSANVVGLTFEGGGVYQAGGTDGGFQVTGGATYSVDRSALVHVMTNVQGALTLTACESVSFWGTIGSLNNDATARNCRVSAVCTGSVAQNWVTSYVETHRSFDVSKTTNGYQKLPNGLIVQWMTCAGVTAVAANYSWPISFPNACLGVSAIGSANGVVYTTSFGVANIAVAASVNQTVYVMAIGH